ncbi:MAG: hypothetical protein BWY85_00468 [Firmicutes bacterium ADurb.Bin506]|nr:MAG: hypothetical protein BWY85_00468 [Firmicutes bacterium ADurb.Bin506]
MKFTASGAEPKVVSAVTDTSTGNCRFMALARFSLPPVVILPVKAGLRSADLRIMSFMVSPSPYSGIAGCSAATSAAAPVT